MTRQQIKLSIVLLFSLLPAILLALHASFLYGPSYWKWHARYIEFWRYFPPMLLAAAPLFAAVFVYGKSRARTMAAIGLVMLSMFAMQIAHIAATVKPMSLSRIVYFVESPMSTSYFNDAIKTLDVPVTTLLSDYPQYLEQFDMHSREKPPGPVMFFRAILLAMGVSDRTALVSGIVIGVLATLCVPATYALIRLVLPDANAGFAGAALIALCPGMILNFPMLDQVYPILTCALIIAWVMALRSGKLRWPIAFGLILSMACLIVYHFLVLGFVVVVLTVKGAGDRARIPGLIQKSLAAIATVALAYFAIYAISGFNAIACFRAALANQSRMLPEFHRPYPESIVFDLSDFALGAGWVPWILAMMAVLNKSAHRGWSVLAIAQIVLVALSGLLQAETARVWCFLLPLLMIPAAAELARWPRPMRLAVFAAMWILLCLVGQNMTFMY